MIMITTTVTVVSMKMKMKMKMATTLTSLTNKIVLKTHSNSNPNLHFQTLLLPTTKPLKPFTTNHFHITPLNAIIQTHPFKEEEEEEKVFDDDNEVGRLYVGNLPYAMASPQSSQYFVEAGRVVSVEIVYDRVTDRSRGFAFVTMGSIKEAKEAIRMYDGSQIGGRTVKVNFPEVPRGGEREVMGPKIRSSNQSFVDSPHKLYAGNLGWALTTQGLRDAFSDQPGLLSAKVVYDRATGRSRGFGFITFSSAEAMESALNIMNGVELEGRPLRLNKGEQRTAITPQPGDDSCLKS